jgi:hypothetical protein
MAGATYGLFLGLLMVALGEWAPQPAGSILLWTMLSVQCAVGLRIEWQRLRLPWLTAGGIAALVVSLAMIPVSALGFNLATMIAALPLPVVVGLWSALLFVPLSIGLESLRGSAEWRAWAAHMEHATVWDMLTFRHIPHLRLTKRSRDLRVPS